MSLNTCALADISAWVAGFVANEFLAEHGGYHQMHRAVLEDKQAGESWTSFPVYEGAGSVPVPSADDLEEYAAVLFSGSKWSSYEDKSDQTADSRPVPAQEAYAGLLLWPSGTHVLHVLRVLRVLRVYPLWLA